MMAGKSKWPFISGSCSVCSQWGNGFLHLEPVVRNGTKLPPAIRDF